jgi:hypothetical protein
MFRLSVIDHVRLDFGQVAQNYTVHAAAAERLAGLLRRCRMTVLALLVIAAAAAITVLVRPARNYEISAAVAAGLALGAFVVYLAVGFEGRVHAHRVCAQRLWVIGERYRALLAELQDGLVDDLSLLRRRDDLIAEMHAVYEQVFPLDQPAFESVRLSGGGTLGDEEIDRLLPASLHRRHTPDAA